MCQFMSYEVHAHLAEWEWHFRLDSGLFLIFRHLEPKIIQLIHKTTDSVIPSEIGYDLFEFMEEKKMLYGFRAIAVCFTS